MKSVTRSDLDTVQSRTNEFDGSSSQSERTAIRWVPRSTPQDYLVHTHVSLIPFYGELAHKTVFTFIFTLSKKRRDLEGNGYTWRCQLTAVIRAAAYVSQDIKVARWVPRAQQCREVRRRRRAICGLSARESSTGTYLDFSFLPIVAGISVDLSA